MERMSASEHATAVPRATENGSNFAIVEPFDLDPG